MMSAPVFQPGFSMIAHLLRATVLAVLTVPACAGAPALAQATGRPTWSETKCANYRSAWTHTLASRGRQGLSAPFLADHQAFLDSGCQARGMACPRSPEELAIANVMVILAMNAGAASTFLPFHCGG
ncbi:hypothetical protein E8L99_10270 [Phreatobacter aquaticus]|uniref:Uncharacterized protein n=1 Tax=Phreatobacter aquaticus TaxID=2570229 RepID=A0A4D7QG08_9HYPH|nr:hypothetical protein [Phreatobacter aquaticus]QCK86108.1 hypothetical protein E8L99_10270 [Phreatobacter aquaticus]